MVEITKCDECDREKGSQNQPQNSMDYQPITLNVMQCGHYMCNYCEWSLYRKYDRKCQIKNHDDHSKLHRQAVMDAKVNGEEFVVERIEPSYSYGKDYVQGINGIQKKKTPNPGSFESSFSYLDYFETALKKNKVKKEANKEANKEAKAKKEVKYKKMYGGTDTLKPL